MCIRLSLNLEVPLEYRVEWDIPLLFLSLRSRHKGTVAIRAASGLGLGQNFFADDNRIAVGKAFENFDVYAIVYAGLDRPESHPPVQIHPDAASDDPWRRGTCLVHRRNVSSHARRRWPKVIVIRLSPLLPSQSYRSPSSRGEASSPDFPRKSPPCR